MTTEPVEEILKHNKAEWQSGHVLTKDNQENTENKGSKLWILSVVLGVLVLVVIVVLGVVFYIRKTRYVLEGMSSFEKFDYTNSVLIQGLQKYQSIMIGGGI